MDNIANEKSVKNKRKKERFDRKEEIRDLKLLLDTDFGRRFVWRVLEKCKTFGSIMSGNSWTYYNSGQQDIGHFILAEIMEANEEAFIKMMLENKQGDSINE